MGWLGPAPAASWGHRRGDEEDRNTSQQWFFTLSHKAGAKPAEKPSRGRFKTCKRKDLSTQLREGIVDLLATGRRVGKGNKGIQDGTRTTAERMACMQPQKSLNKQRLLNEAAGEGVWGLSSFLRFSPRILRWPQMTPAAKPSAFQFLSSMPLTQVFPTSALRSSTCSSHRKRAVPSA